MFNCQAPVPSQVPAHSTNNSNCSFPSITETVGITCILALVLFMSCVERSSAWLDAKLYLSSKKLLFIFKPVMIEIDTGSARSLQPDLPVQKVPTSEVRSMSGQSTRKLSGSVNLLITADFELDNNDIYYIPRSTK